MLKTIVKKPYNGLHWVAERYVDGVRAGETLEIVYEGQTMTVTPEWLEKNPPLKGKEQYINRFQKEGEPRGQKYHLFGFVFEPDQKPLL